MSKRTLTGLNPYRSSPSSVNVPVLSKTQVETLPDIFIFGGEMQKIFFFLSLLIANIIPMLIAAGKEGGTVIVKRSRPLIKTSMG